LGGARFTVVLPIHAPEGVSVENADGIAESDISAAFITQLLPQLRNGEEIGGAQGGLVLVVEDNPDMRNYLVSLLTDRYRVETAGNGREGLERAQTLVPDLIISDVMMPHMNGDEMAVELLANALTRDIPLLMLTAKMDDPLKMRLLREGVRDYIAKPFSGEELGAKAGRLVAERRNILAGRERLVQQLTRSNHDLERFAFATAHDLKSPLRSIDNLASWIEEDAADSLPEDSGEHLRKLRSQVRRMERLLDGVLEYSRMTADMEAGEGEIISGTTLMEDIVALVAPANDFTIVAAEQFDALQIQRMPLQQILYNLVMNAVQHHHKGEGRVEVSVEDLGGRLAFSVRDDGPGIDLQYHEKIFDMFQTLTPRSNRESSGMGLAMARKLVAAHGGDISVDSKPGYGACFRFTWPKTFLGERREYEPQYA
jgi:signal transduction histidine kinase